MLLLTKFFYRLKRDKVTAIAAQLAYFLILSIFPFTMFLLNILSFTPYFDENIIYPFITILPWDIQNIITSLITETVNSSSETLLSISAIMGLWAASKGTLAFIGIMNDAYDVEESRSYIHTRFLSLIFTLALLLTFVLALMALVFGQILAEKVIVYLGLGKIFIYFWKYFRIILALLFMILIFALLYKLGPSLDSKLEINFLDALPGAIFSSLGWVVTSLGFSYYVNNFGNFAKTYGSLAAIVILLFWLYMSSIIIIMGGELNATLSCLKTKNS